MRAPWPRRRERRRPGAPASPGPGSTTTAAARAGARSTQVFVPSSVIGPGLGARTQCATPVTSPPVQPGPAPPPLRRARRGPGSPPPRPSRSMRSTSSPPAPRATQGETGRGCPRASRAAASTSGAAASSSRQTRVGRQHRQLAARRAARPRRAGRSHAARSPSPPRSRASCPGGSAATIEPGVEPAVLERRRDPPRPRPQAAGARPRAPSAGSTSAQGQLPAARPHPPRPPTPATRARRRPGPRRPASTGEQHPALLERLAHGRRQDGRGVLGAGAAKGTAGSASRGVERAAREDEHPGGEGHPRHPPEREHLTAAAGRRAASITVAAVADRGAGVVQRQPVGADAVGHAAGQGELAEHGPSLAAPRCGARRRRCAQDPRRQALVFDPGRRIMRTGGPRGRSGPHHTGTAR